MTTVNGFGERQDPVSVIYGAKINQGGGAPLTRRIPRPWQPGACRTVAAGGQTFQRRFVGRRFGSPMAPNAGEAALGGGLDVVSCIGLARRSNDGGSVGKDFVCTDNKVKGALRAPA
jgi:hypothetical protein